MVPASTRRPAGCAHRTGAARQSGRGPALDRPAPIVFGRRPISHETSMDAQSYIGPILDFVKANQAWAPAIIFALTFCESLAILSLIIPAWAMIVAFGPLIGAGGIPFWPILVAASLGAAAGDWVSYWFGRYFKDGIAKIWPLSKYPDLLPKGHQLFERWGVWAIFIGRFSGPLRASVPLVAGVVAMPQWKFQIANVVSAFIWAGALLAPGNFLGQYMSWFH
jgi:membrane protein DedA with SNARE-associated domain